VTVEGNDVAQTNDGTQGGFAQQAQQRRQGFVSELFDFMMNNKKWWVTPIILALLLVGTLIFMSGTAVAPFIYTLF
jgi:hypothetical protein